MEKSEEKKQEIDSTDQGFFFTDLKGIQLLSGGAALSAVFITILAVLFLPAQIDKTLIVYIAIFISAFIVVYYSIPSFNLNPHFMLLPDIVFVIAITATMYALKDFGEFFLVFFIILLAVDAFAFRLRDFIAVISMIICSLLFTNFVLGNAYFSLNEIIFRSIIQVYSILIFAVIVRFFAKEALTEKTEKEQIKRLAKNTLSAIKQLRNLLDNIGNGIFAVDMEEKIILTNTKAVEILEWKKAIGGRKLSDVMPLYNQKMQRVDLVKKVLEQKRTISHSDLSIIRDEESLKVYVNVSPVMSEDEVQGAIVLFRDITKEKALEEQKDEFVAVSSHELRTPLTIIEGYLYYLLTNKKLKYDRNTKTYLEKAHKSCLYLKDLITDLLEASRVEQNRMKLFLEELNVADIVKEIVSDFKNRMKGTSLKLILEMKQKRMPNSMVDKDRLREVFSNLIENAIKFTDKGFIKISLEKVDKFIKVGVSDTGAGIRKEDQKYIFDKFYRVEAWRTKKTGGTGLGLYISRSIIEKLKGKIWVESQLNKGATFYFTIPVLIKKSKIAKKDKKEKELKDFVGKL